MIPTERGTYQTANVSGGADVAATGAAAVRYAFAAKTLSSAREFVVSGTKIWEFTTSPSLALTDRTNGVSVGATNRIMMAQYGDVTHMVNGVGTATAKSTGTTFSALAGAPQAEIILVCRNAVLYFNTNTAVDGWAATDVGDYTNFTTGEAASGRIISTPGPISGAVNFGDDVMVFKPSAIYLMSYVGGAVKWLVRMIWNGIGLEPPGASSPNCSKFQVVATALGVVFRGHIGTDQDHFPGAGQAEYTNTRVYLFDGARPPFLLNPLTTIGGGSWTVYRYEPTRDMLVLCPDLGSNASGLTSFGFTSLYYYYHFPTGAWGQGCGSADEATTDLGSNGAIHGDWGVILPDFESTSRSRPGYWAYLGVTDELTRSVSDYQTFPGSCYIQTSLYGRPDGKTDFTRNTPILRRRVDLGTDSVTCDLTLYSAKDGSATTTRTGIAESSFGRWFDFQGGTYSDTFAKLKTTWNNLDVEVDGFLVKQRFVPDAK